MYKEKSTKVVSSKTLFHQLLQVARTNLAMLFNAGSLVATTFVTSLLGFAYWWIAARFYPPHTVGLASAMLSAMTLLGTVSMLGLGTLLTGELPRQPGKEWPLIDAALIVVGGTGVIAGLVFALLAPLISPDFDTLGTHIVSSVLFALGVGFAALTMVLDQALIGILRGDLQLWRNTLFAALKLATLCLAGLLLSREAGIIIYATWLIGNVFSLGVVFLRRKPETTTPTDPQKATPSTSHPGLQKSYELPCPDCGVLAPENARFCPNCGCSLVPTIELASVRPQLLLEYGALKSLAASGRTGNTAPDNLCADCGNSSPATADFCSSCGYPLTPTLKMVSVKINQPQPVPVNASVSTAVSSPAVPEQGEKSRYLPQWDLLRKLGKAAFQHHILNLILLVPPLVLPILVTVQLSATENAWFYIAFMLANFVFSLTYALSTVLYAVGSAQPAALAKKIRFTLGLSVITSVGANIVLQAGAGLLLGIFGHAYADQAAWCLRILSMAVFPLIIISHYIAICRIQQRLTYVMLPILLGTIIELASAVVGAHLSGLIGLSLGWLAGLTLEALYMLRTVYRAAYPLDTHTRDRDEEKNLPPFYEDRELILSRD